MGFQFSCAAFQIARRLVYGTSDRDMGRRGRSSRTDGRPRTRGPLTIGKMMGTANQVDWAVQIKVRVSAEFDRVARALASAANRQTEQDRMDTLAVIAILEDKRAEVMRNAQAGYFIHDWQELRDQVRRMIVQDSRYKTIKGQSRVGRQISQINPNWRLDT